MDIIGMNVHGVTDPLTSNTILTVCYHSQIKSVRLRTQNDFDTPMLDDEQNLEWMNVSTMSIPSLRMAYGNC